MVKLYPFKAVKPQASSCETGKDTLSIYEGSLANCRVETDSVSGSYGVRTCLKIDLSSCLRYNLGWEIEQD